MKTNYIEQQPTLTNGRACRCRVPLVFWQADQYAVAIRQPEQTPPPAVAADSARANQLSAAGMAACLWPGRPMPADCGILAGANLGPGD
jgi:hypothetical protein